MPALPHGIALAGQNMQDLFAGGRNKLDGQHDAQEPGNVVNVGRELASAVALAVEGSDRPKPLKGSHVGKGRVDGAVNVEVAGRARRADSRSEARGRPRAARG